MIEWALGIEATTAYAWVSIGLEPSRCHSIVRYHPSWSSAYERGHLGGTQRHTIGRFDQISIMRLGCVRAVYIALRYLVVWLWSRMMMTMKTSRRTKSSMSRSSTLLVSRGGRRGFGWWRWWCKPSEYVMVQWRSTYVTTRMRPANQDRAFGG